MNHSARVTGWAIAVMVTMGVIMIDNGNDSDVMIAIVMIAIVMKIMTPIIMIITR